MADSEDIVSGKTAIAIGTPLSMSLRNSVTKGIISGTTEEMYHSDHNRDICRAIVASIK